MQVQRGFAIDKGYGKIKGKTFRLAHMGDMPVETLSEALSGIEDFMAQT